LIKVIGRKEQMMIDYKNFKSGQSRNRFIKKLSLV